MVSEEERERTLVKILALDAKLSVNTELAKLYKADPEKFLADCELDPEEVAMVRSRDTEEMEHKGSCSVTNSGLTVGDTVNPTHGLPCSCCAVLWGNCGTGCSPKPVGGSTVG